MVNPKYIATNRVVERDELNDFIRPRHHGVLLTNRRDGWPQSSLVSIGLDESIEGQSRIVVSSYPERAKVYNLRRNSNASMLVQSDEFNGQFVQVDFSDYWESLKMGEEIAIGLLEEQKLCFREEFTFTVPLFDGGVRNI